MAHIFSVTTKAIMVDVIIVTQLSSLIYDECVQRFLNDVLIYQLDQQN